MSIAPLPTGPSVAPAATTGETASSGESADGAFAALVSSLLGEDQPTSPVATGGEGAVVPPVLGEEASVDPAAEETADPEVDQAASLAAPAWQALAGQVPAAVPATGATPAAVAPQDAADAVGAAAPTAAAGEPGATEAAVAKGAAPAPAAAGPQAVDAGASATAQAATGDSASTPTGGDAAEGEAGDQPAAAPARAAAETGPTAPTASSTTTAATAATAPASAPAAAAPTTAAGTEGARPVPVVDQLAPEVTRLVSRGDGLHRLTMLLQPEALGEVRVTLTIRDGEVLVRFAAGDDAQRALLEGAPELRRVLELAGASDARVVVRDLPAAPGSQPGSQQGWGQTPERSAHPDSSGAFGSGGDTHPSGRDRTDQQDQHARTRGGSTATDGLTDGASQLRPNPVAGAPQGIDLTM